MQRSSSFALSALAAALIAGCGGGGDTTSDKTTLAVIGDMPYGATADDTAQSVMHPAFIKALNGDADVSLVLHVGDIHSGKQLCTEAYDMAVYRDWTALKSPLVYTPGDNEWTDCQKSGEGGGVYNATTGRIDFKLDASGSPLAYAGGDPAANLDLVRAVFFAKPGKTLGAAMDVHTQAQEFDAAHPSDSHYVENVWFMKSRVLFVTLNVPGGSNNDTDPWHGAPAMSPAQALEVANRSEADKRWLDAAFKRAASENAIAVVIQLQADMWDLDGKAASHIAQYKQFTDRIAANARDFGKPVLLLNGDSHTYRSDNPLQAGAACLIEPASGKPAAACSDDAYANQPHGYSVPNFHRIVVHGSTTPLEWLKLTIDPDADPKRTGPTTFGPFSWQRMQPAL